MKVLVRKRRKLLCTLIEQNSYLFKGISFSHAHVMDTNFSSLFLICWENGQLCYNFEPLCLSLFSFSNSSFYLLLLCITCIYLQETTSSIVCILSHQLEHLQLLHMWCRHHSSWHMLWHSDGLIQHQSSFSWFHFFSII